MFANLQLAIGTNNEHTDLATIAQALAELPRLPRPTYVVLFDSVLEQLRLPLQSPGLQLEEVASFHHSHFAMDADAGAAERRLQVLRRRPALEDKAL